MDGTGQSRGARRTTGARGLALALAAVILAGAAAPDQVDRTKSDSSPPGDAAIAGSLLTTARVTRPRRVVCGEAQQGGEIVVCGADRGERWRVPSTADSDPESRQGTNDGLPRAPSLSSLPDCRHRCIGIGKAPPPLYLVDLRKMPPAPAGSDADLIARGEMAER